MKVRNAEIFKQCHWFSDCWLGCKQSGLGELPCAVVVVVVMDRPTPPISKCAAWTVTQRPCSKSFVVFRASLTKQESG